MLVNGETIRRPIGRASEIGRKAIWMNDFDARYAGLWSPYSLRVSPLSRSRAKNRKSLAPRDSFPIFVKNDKTCLMNSRRI